MAKDNTWVIAAAIIVAVLLMNNGAETPITTGGTAGVDLCAVVDGDASFTGQNMYLAGTALTGEYVRVLKQNGEGVKDLGQISLNSGTIGLAPKGQYKLLYGENSSDFYTAIESYTAPCQDATDDKVGKLCTIDTTPTITVKDENGQVQSASANSQTIGTSESVEVEIKLKVSADECYGNPSAAGKNAICFNYNSTIFQSVKANTASSGTPYSISSDKGAGLAQNCYEADKLADTASQLITVTLKANSGQTPTSAHNITVSLEDVGFDLDADSLEEIYGFEDESNTNLGAAVVTGTIYIAD